MNTDFSHRTVGIINYHSGNIRSVRNALEYIGASVKDVLFPADIAGCSHLVLPGVGAFGYCISRLMQSGLYDEVKKWSLVQCKPILGICVGMQMLADHGEEMGKHRGLGWISGRVIKLNEFPESGIRIPHVGWNSVCFSNDFGFLSREKEYDFYFDHSYFFNIEDPQNEFGTTYHGQRICVAVKKGNIIGVQFHPEKSQESGKKLFQSFLNME